MKKMSRLESSKEVRRVLNRHCVDLSFCQYSVAGMDVRLSGRLKKTNGSDYNTPQIENMLQDFQRYLMGYTVNGDFENWKFTSDHISFLGMKEGSTVSALGVGEFEDDDYDFEAS